MTTALISDPATSISDETVGTVAAAIAMGFEDDYPIQKVVKAHVNGLDLLLRSRGGLSAFHRNPWVVGLLTWALTTSGGGGFQTRVELQSCRAEIGVMLRNLHTLNLNLIQKSATGNTQDWLTYFLTREQLFGVHSPFRALILPSNPALDHSFMHTTGPSSSTTGLSSPRSLTSRYGTIGRTLLLQPVI
jgi:hypothetical protein